MKRFVWLALLLTLLAGCAPSPGCGVGVPWRAVVSALPDGTAPWVSIGRADRAVTHWEIVASWYVPPEQVGGGPANVYALIGDVDGRPTLEYRAVQRNGGVIALAPHLNDAGQAQADFPMSADSSFAPDRGERGPYSVEIEGYPSDVARGLGLPLRRHVQYWFVFRLTAGVVPSVTPTPVFVPSPTPSADLQQYLLSRLARALRLAADDLEKPQ